MQNGKSSKKRIGWREWLSLPELGIPAIKAKIDTGARTSALHAFKVAYYQNRGRGKVKFGLHPFQRKNNPELVCEAEVIDERMVTDSGGHREKRYVITTPIVLGGHEFPIEITLTNRDSMGFRMLIGRTALKGKFFVDPNTSYRCGKWDGKTIITKSKRKRED